jgi:hypothetical protein
MKANSRAALSAVIVTASALLTGAVLPAAAQDKPSGTVTATETRTATVEKIDAKDRWVTLKLKDGTLVDVQAGPAVKNFAQIKVGDKVVATQTDTVSVEVVPAGQAAPNVSGGSATVSAPLGAKPMGVQVDTVVVSGKVTAIDQAKRTVTLQGPEGNSRTFDVGKAVKKFHAVKVGDVVVITLKSATAIDVQSPGK